LLILSGSVTRIDRFFVSSKPVPRAIEDQAPTLKAIKSMQNLSPRHVKMEESLRLGVVSGWYSTKVSGTFVSGPHDSEADCLRKIEEINPQPKKRR
jgi:hypothetical protein